MLFWFGLGALGAGLAAMAGFGLPIQFAVFAAISIGLTVMSRTIFAKYLPHTEDGEVKTGVDSLPGQAGLEGTTRMAQRLKDLRRVLVRSVVNIAEIDHFELDVVAGRFRQIVT